MKETFLSVLLVGSGGFIGAALRYGAARLLHSQTTPPPFPFATLAVNLVGCLLIGLLMGLVDGRQLFSPEFRSFAIMGLLGAFTTYSTFGLEAIVMLREAQFLRAGIYVGIHLVAGLFLVWAGYALAMTQGKA